MAATATTTRTSTSAASVFGSQSGNNDKTAHTTSGASRAAAAATRSRFSRPDNLITSFRQASTGDRGLAQVRHRRCSSSRPPLRCHGVQAQIVAEVPAVAIVVLIPYGETAHPRRVAAQLGGWDVERAVDGVCVAAGVLPVLGGEQARARVSSANATDVNAAY
ncbi:MAG TPA: hypothetical protein VIM19_07255 [Actinomycetes bacterium]